jgi:hypothetical protein
MASEQLKISGTKCDSLIAVELTKPIPVQPDSDNSQEHHWLSLDNKAGAAGCERFT